MFQFPGFALLTLWIQVKSTWLTALLAVPEHGNNEVSGGLPHSEIRGSKPILGSPRLIAEYHVLHRLLLPRHSPNALLALDLIQKKTGFFCTAAPFDFAAAGPIPRGIRPDQKHTFPPFHLVQGMEGVFAARRAAFGLVYLTWIVTCFASGRPDCSGAIRRSRAHCPDQHDN